MEHSSKIDFIFSDRREISKRITPQTNFTEMSTRTIRIEAYAILESKTKVKLCQFSALGKVCRKEQTGECPFSHCKDEQTKFISLADKRKESSKKTQMCANLQTIGRCPHGKRCTFAHSIEELKLPICLFGKECKTMKGKNPCLYVHPDETSEQYRARTGRPHPHDSVAIATVPESWKNKCDKVSRARQERFRKEQEEALEIAMLKMEAQEKRILVEQDCLESLAQKMSKLDLPNEGEEGEEGEEDEEDDDFTIIINTVPQLSPKVNVSLTTEQFTQLLPAMSKMGISFSS